jgi:cell shape-determining protein MreC
MRYGMLGVVLVVVLGAIGLFRTPITGLVWRVMAPVEQGKGAAQNIFGNFFSNFASNRALVTENTALKEALASTSIALMDRNILYSENQDLKARLGRLREGTTVTLAAVLARPPETPYDTLMLDVGSTGGVIQGDLVSVGGSVYVGKIQAVYPTTSRVVLFSSSGQTFDALLLHAGTTSLALKISGQGGGSLMAQVPAQTQVQKGDKVLLPSIATDLLATVSAVESNALSSFKTIYFELPINIHAVRFVEVRRQISL